MISGSDVTVRRQLALTAAGSTLLVIDLRRYERWLLDAFDQGKGAGHTIVALTDGLLSPLAMGAAPLVHDLGRRRCRRSTATSARWPCCDLLVATTAERLKDSAAERLQRVESGVGRGGSLTDP